MAITIRNLLISLSGAKKLSETPKCTDIVVTAEAQINHNMNIGNALFKLNLPEPDALPALTSASTSVIGIMARVLVSLTVTALSRV